MALLQPQVAFVAFFAFSRKGGELIRKKLPARGRILPRTGSPSEVDGISLDGRWVQPSGHQADYWRPAKFVDMSCLSRARRGSVLGGRSRGYNAQCTATKSTMGFCVWEHLSSDFCLAAKSNTTAKRHAASCKPHGIKIVPHLRFDSRPFFTGHQTARCSPLARFEALTAEGGWRRRNKKGCWTLSGR